MTGEAPDVIVVGAGPGGSAAAYHLAARGAQVLLLDKAVFPREKVCGDGLTPRAVAALDEMDVLDRVLPLAHPADTVQVTAPDGAGVSAVVPLPAVASGRARLARPAMLVVPRLHLDDAIRTRAVEAGASFEGGVEIRDIVRDDGHIVARGVRGGRSVTYRARLAVLATGASIALPRRLGAFSRPPAMMMAARTYIAQHGAPRIEIRFAGVPLPGYGWIFPISASAANVGVGFFVRRRTCVPAAQTACERFLATLDGAGAPADRTAPIRSYPLRVDFPASPVSADGVLFCGEAAGLVNPLTGEGIDYALESGAIAADHAAAFLAGGDPSARGFAAVAAGYERALRTRFERLFTLCRVVRDISARPMILNRLVRVAARRDDLTAGLINLVLGNRPPVGAALVSAALARALFVR